MRGVPEHTCYICKIRVGCGSLQPWSYGGLVPSTVEKSISNSKCIILSQRGSSFKKTQGCGSAPFFCKGSQEGTKLSPVNLFLAQSVCVCWGERQHIQFPTEHISFLITFCIPKTVHRAFSACSRRNVSVKEEKNALEHCLPRRSSIDHPALKHVSEHLLSCLPFSLGLWLTFPLLVQPIC